jgi:hypothetical protein
LYRKSFGCAEAKQVNLELQHMELHFANIMVTAKFIIESNREGDDMNYILVSLRQLALKYA